MPDLIQEIGNDEAQDQANGKAVHQVFNGVQQGLPEYRIADHNSIVFDPDKLLLGRDNIPTGEGNVEGIEGGKEPDNQVKNTGDDQKPISPKGLLLFKG